MMMMMMRSPSVKYRNNAFIAPSGNAKEGRHWHVKVVARRITPPSLVVRRAEVGRRYNHRGTAQAPLRVKPAVAYNLIASTARLPTPE